MTMVTMTIIILLYQKYLRVNDTRVLAKVTNFALRLLKNSPPNMTPCHVFSRNMSSHKIFTHCTSTETDDTSS